MSFTGRQCNSDLIIPLVQVTQASRAGSGADLIVNGPLEKLLNSLQNGNYL